MKRFFIFVFSVVLSTVVTIVAHGQCRSITSEGPPYGPALTEDFDTLAASGTSSALPTGWLMAESGINANGTYVAGNGSDADGNTYSFGATGSTNRTFGGLRSGSLIPTIGACFTNNTSSPLRYFSIMFDGKKWRAGETAGGDKLVFEYSVDATSLTSGTWFRAPNPTLLDYTSPSSPTIGAVDGNSVFTHRQGGVGPHYVPVGGTIYIRWTDFDVTGADDGLGIDNFYLAPYISIGAFVDVGGRVTRADGTPIYKARLTLYNSDGTIQTALTSPFGYYNFPATVEAGTTIVLTVSAKGYTFAEPARVITVFDTITDANFVADP